MFCVLSTARGPDAINYWSSEYFMAKGFNQIGGQEDLTIIV